MKEVIATTNAPGAIGPYSQATKAGSLVFVSGQLPIDPATGVMPEDVSAQTKQSLTNGKALIEAAGGSMADVVKTTVFLADMNDFAAMNAVYAEFFPEGACPARSAVQVARLPKDAKVEIELIANIWANHETLLFRGAFLRSPDVFVQAEFPQSSTFA